MTYMVVEHFKRNDAVPPYIAGFGIAAVVTSSEAAAKIAPSLAVTPRRRAANLRQ